MKRTLLALSFILTIFPSIINAQCVGGPDPLCTGTSGPCGNLHNGTIGQAYADTISFWAPNQVDATIPSGGLFGWVDFVEFKINNVTGLPAGLTWNCGNGSCIYDPQPSGTLCNINICGTPIVSGTFNLTIYTVGTVSTPFGNQSGNENFNLTLTINALSGGNAAFNFSPAVICDSGTVTFSPLISFPLPQWVTYDWDFGGGNTYSGSTPPPMDYNTPGIYPVTCTTNVYNLVLTQLNTNVCGQGWWCGDIEELNCSNGNADIVPTFTTGSSSWTGAEVTDNCISSWNPISFLLTGTSYSISMHEVDVISATDYPAGPYTGTVTGPGVYNFNYPGNFSGSFTIGLSLLNQIIVTDTVFVYPTPVMDTIQATSTSFCPYDSVTLSVYPGYYYEWYLNDTVQVQVGNNNQYTTSDAGNYSVKIIDPVSGCYVLTDNITLSTYPAIPPGFASVGIVESTPGTYSSQLIGAYTYQWLYYNGATYYTIPAPEGTASSITPTFEGIYCLVATNTYGCLDTSNCMGYFLGNENLNSPFMASIYPNPSDGVVTIDLNNLNQDATLLVYDMVGKVVHTELMVGQGHLIQQVDLTTLQSGIYIVEIRNQQHRYTQRIIMR